MLGLSNNLVSANFVDVYQSNKSIEFDSSNDHITCGTGIGTSLGDGYDGGLTVSMWVKPEVGDHLQGLFEIGDYSGGGDTSPFMMNLLTNSKFKLRTVGTSGGEVSSYGTCVPERWQQVVGVYDGAGNTQYIYVDGALADSDTQSEALDFDGEKTVIGSYYDVGYSPMQGHIDDVAIWNTALSANAVTAIYNNGKPTDLRSNSGNYTSASSLVGYWQLGDGKLGADVDGTDDVIFDMDNASLGSDVAVNGDLSSDPFAHTTNYSGGWSDTSIGTSEATWSSGNQTISCVGDNSGSNRGNATARITTVSGKVYKMSYTNSTTPVNANLKIGTSNSWTAIEIANISPSSDEVHYFKSTVSGYVYITFSVYDANTWTFGNFKVELVNGNAGIMTNFDGSDIQTEVPKQVKGLPAVANTYSLEFDGTDDYLDIGTGADSVWRAQSKITLTGWFNIDTHKVTNGLIGKKNGDAHRTKITCTDSKFQMTLADGTDKSSGATSSAPSAGAWHHFACVFDGSQTGDANRCKIYIDGVQETLTFTTHGGSGMPSTLSNDATYASNKIAIGNGNVGGDKDFHGELDEFAVYNTALDGDSIRAIYNNGNPTNLKNNTGAYDEYTDNLVAYYRMGDGTLDSYPLIGDEVTPTLGSELITNGTFTGIADGTDPVGNITGWASYGSVTTREIDSERLKLVTTGGNTGAQLTATVISGKTYQFSCTATGDLGADGVYTSGAHTGNVSTASGTASKSFTAGSTSLVMVFRAGNNEAGTTYYDNITLKPVNGNAGIMTNMASGDIVEDTP